MNKLLIKIATRFWDRVAAKATRNVGKKESMEVIKFLRRQNKADHRPVIPEYHIHNAKELNSPYRAYDRTIRENFKTSKPADPKQTYTGKGHLVDRLINRRVETGKVYPGGRNFVVGSLRAKVTKKKGPSFRTAIVEMVKKRQQGF